MKGCYEINFTDITELTKHFNIYQWSFQEVVFHVMNLWLWLFAQKSKRAREMLKGLRKIYKPASSYS